MKNTGMNNKGPERKERRAAALVCAFLSVLLLACLLTGVVAAAESEGATEPLHKSVEIKFASDGSDRSITIDYDEQNFFFSSTSPATEYNLELAKASIAMAGAAFSSLGAEYAAEGEEAAKTRYKNLETAYGQLGFSKMEFHNYGEPLNKTNDYVAYGIAKKEIKVGDDTWTLFAVQVRGSGYAGEWVSNFHIDPYEIGDSYTKDGIKYSEGFGKPAETIYNTLKEKLDSISAGDDGKKKVKIWISGFSRAAAVSNALGGELTRNAGTLGLKAENIYAYTFATPNAVLINSSKDVEADYKNIHNTLNPCDIVPVVPMSANGWNYDRYGTTHYFNYGGASGFTPEEGSKIAAKYLNITSDEYDPYTPKSDTAFLPVLFELCFSQTVPRDEYIADFYPYLEEIISLVFCGEEQDATRLLFLNDNLDELHPDDEQLRAAKLETQKHSEENEELDDRVLSFLISRALEILDLFSDDSDNAASNRASNSLDERDGPIEQFTDGVVTVGFYQGKEWNDSDRFLTTAAKLVDNLLAEISALKDSGYKIKNITTITKEHHPEVYMAVLFSGISENRLFAPTHPILSQLHAIVYDTNGGTMPEGYEPVVVYQTSKGSVNISEIKPTMTNYVFLGWVDENGQSITTVNVSTPGYTRVTATWERTYPIEDGTAKIGKWNIDTITLPGISDGYLIVDELPSPENIPDNSVPLSAVTVKYEPSTPSENLMLTAAGETSDSDSQDFDTPTVIITFSIPEETAKYLAKLSPSHDIITHPELAVMKYLDGEDWENLETESVSELKYQSYAYTDHLSLENPSSFAVCVDKLPEPKPEPTPRRSSSSSSQGTSIWLTAAPTPEPTLEPTPTPTMEAPVVVPLKPAAQTSQSPGPFAGVLAGICAAGILLWMRRR